MDKHWAQGGTQGNACAHLRRYVRCVGVLALVMIALTLAANSVLPVVNSRALPHLECAVAHVLDREVRGWAQTGAWERYPRGMG